MQWKSFINFRNRHGFVCITLLMILLILAIMVNTLIHFINDSLISQRNHVRHKQVAHMGRELLKTTIKKSSGRKAFSCSLPPILLYPGQERVTPKIHVEDRKEMPLRAINLEIVYNDGKLKMQQLIMDVPGGKEHEIYTSCCAEGAWENSNIPRLDLEGFNRYKNMPLPSQSDLENYGLLDRLYCNVRGNHSRSYKIKPCTVIRGSGVLFNNMALTIGEKCVCENKIWLISNEKINIRKGTVLKKAFIYSNGDISIGDDVVLNGVIVARGNILWGEKVKFTEDKKLLNAFSTACYLL